MSPSATDDHYLVQETPVNKTKVQLNGSSKTALIIEPLKPNGILNQFQSFDVTPAIGREFRNVNVVDWLHAPNSDELLRELAITSMFPNSMGAQKTYTG